MAERQTRRLKALELQNAIRAQVEERERIKRMEHERTLLEDRRNEDRLRQQFESNDQRAEEEQRRYLEKMQRDQEKQEAMCIAIEKARQEAELEKAKKRMLHIQVADDCAELDSGRNDKIENDVRQRSSDTNHSSDSAIQPNGSDESFGSKSFSTDSLIERGYDDDDDDGEKILIGTPIKMRKKTINRQASKKPMAANGAVGTPTSNNTATEAKPVEGTTIDGIALLLQAMPPLMPITPSDIQNLNQNLNTLNSNNIQLAAMLTQQMQQLNSLANGRSVDAKVVDIRSNECHADETSELVTCKRCSNQSNEQSMDGSLEVLSDCVTGFTEMVAGEANDVGKETMLPNVDTTVGPTDEPPPADHKSQTFDAATQTENKYGLEYCFQCRYHSCHHHHVVLKDVTQRCGDDVKIIALDQLKAKCLDRDCSATHANQMLDIKDAKELPVRLEDRPKWGVNRPQQQYIKASDRDPFYLRNKRKKHNRRHPFADSMAYDDGTADRLDDKEDGQSRAPSPNPSVITNSTVILSSPQVMAMPATPATPATGATPSPKSKRTVCTEILPIKTDVNGRVYLNFNESNMILSEDDIKVAGQQQRSNKAHRMTNRCQTVNALRGIKRTEAKIATRSLKSADQDLLTCS